MIAAFIPGSRNYNDHLENAICEKVKKWLERVKNKSIKASESPVPLTGNYGNNASINKIPHISRESNLCFKNPAGGIFTPK